MPLGIALIHSHKHASEKRRLVAAGAGSYLDYNVSLVVFILGKQQNLEVLKLFLPFRGKLPKLLLGKKLHILIGALILEDRPRFLQPRFYRREFIVGGDYRFEVRMLLHKLAPPRLIRYHGGVAYPFGDLNEMRLHLFKSCKHYSPSGKSASNSSADNS